MVKSKQVSEKDRRKEIPYKTKSDSNGNRMMQCQNSIPNGKWWKGSLCDNWSVVSSDAVAVLCWRCVTQHVEPPIYKGAVAKSDKPKGWKFMKEYVAQDGTVYHKGVEQPELKGTLPPTVIEVKEPKKKLTKEEKFKLTKELSLEIKNLKAELFIETKKGKRQEINRALTKANRELKKLMK